MADSGGNKSRKNGKTKFLRSQAVADDDDDDDAVHDVVVAVALAVGKSVGCANLRAAFDHSLAPGILGGADDESADCHAHDHPDQALADDQQRIFPDKDVSAFLAAGEVRGVADRHLIDFGLPGHNCGQAAVDEAVVGAEVVFVVALKDAVHAGVVLSS